MLSAFWASYKVLWTLQWAKVKDFLKVDPKQENFTTNLSSSIFNLQQFANTSHKHESRSDSIAEETPVTKSKPSEYQSLINKKLSKVPLSSASSGSTKASSPVGDDMKAALKAFEHTLAKNWNQGHLQLERGTFLVSGLVEVVGFKAVCVLEVWAMYHPREAKWGTLALGVRKMRPRNQKPRANFKAG